MYKALEDIHHGDAVWIHKVGAYIQQPPGQGDTWPRCDRCGAPFAPTNSIMPDLYND